jgi:AraC-like DNA-binding protein
MHDVDYRPDDRSPFQLGTVHLVPRHAAHVPVSPHVPYLDDDPLLRSSGRGGDGGPRRAVAASDHVPAGRRLLSLGSYCVERWGEGFDTRIFGPLAELLLAEIRACSAPGDEVLGVPAALAAMTEHILANLDSPLTVAEIARAGGCSTATAARLFARHTGRSVQAWVREQRMRRAAVLLRSTGMRVGEVAREVGYADPLYFSRVFTATHSVPPSRYAREGIRL